MKRNNKTNSDCVAQLAEVACQLSNSRGLNDIHTAFESKTLGCETIEFERSTLVQSSVAVETQAISISEYFRCLIETGITENLEHRES